MNTPQALGTHLAQAPAPRLFLALWGGMAVVDLARAGQAPAIVQVGLLTALAAVCAVGQGTTASLAAAAVVWLVMVGFVVNRAGELALTGPADVVRLAIVSAVALAASAVTR